MNRTHKNKNYVKLFRFFLFAQISTLLVAVAINTILLLPNDFKVQHKAYEACLEKQEKQPLPTDKACVKPYSN